MRLWIISLTLAAGGCSTQSVEAPSLSVREAESIDPRVPILPEGTPVPASLEVQADVMGILNAARNGDQAFQAAVPETRTVASAAGAEQSESWIAAQVALARLERLRAPVANASAQIDQLLGDKIKDGSLTSGDLELLVDAAAEMRGTSDRQLAILSDIKSSMDR